MPNRVLKFLSIFFPKEPSFLGNPTHLKFSFSYRSLSSYYLFQPKISSILKQFFHMMIEKWKFPIIGEKEYIISRPFKIPPCQFSRIGKRKKKKEKRKSKHSEKDSWLFVSWESWLREVVRWARVQPQFQNW